MKFLFAVLSLSFACVAAQADVWKWVDESGDIHYSDTPDHEDAVSVELVWVSGGTLDEAQDGKDKAGSGYAYPGETPEERAEREEAEAYYCKRATEIYDSYVNAPRLYKTSETGERVYLSKEEAAKTIAATRAQKDDLCR